MRHIDWMSKIMLARGLIVFYGYLCEADTLCYWERERVQVRSLVLGESETPPSCVL